MKHKRTSQLELLNEVCMTTNYIADVLKLSPDTVSDMVQLVADEIGSEHENIGILLQKALDMCAGSSTSPELANLKDFAWEMMDTEEGIWLGDWDDLLQNNPNFIVNFDACMLILPQLTLTQRRKLLAEWRMIRAAVADKHWKAADPKTTARIQVALEVARKFIADKQAEADKKAQAGKQTLTKE